MSELHEKIKGKVKETIGTAKDDRELEKEGKTDRTKAEVGEKVKREVEEAVERHRDRE